MTGVQTCALPISTKKHKLVTFQEDTKDPFPLQPSNNKTTNACFLTTTEPKDIVSTDQTGRLPRASTSGNNYLLIAYDYDSNSILLRPYKNKTAQVLTATIANIHDTLAKGGCKRTFHRLGNECPSELTDYFKRQKITHQLVPPHDHRTNSAKRAIRTAKNHLAAGWASTDPQFPMNLWDRTIPQAELTLNLMRGSRINPKLSAWEQIHGRFDFNATPIAPPGIKVLAHLKTDQRESWSPHAFPAWYIGPALAHYRCFTVWATKTRQERVVNQLMWFPKKPFPKLTSADLLRATIEDLKTILLSPPAETYLGHMEQTQLGELISFCDTIHDHVQTKYPTPKLGVPQATSPAPELGVVPTQATRPAPELGVVPPPARPEPTQPPVPPQGPRRSDRATKAPTRYTPDNAYLSYNSEDLHTASTTFHQEYPFLAFPAINPDTGRPAEYRILVKSSAGPRWSLAMCKELGRLFQGYVSIHLEHSVQGTQTCHFIRPEEIPPGKKATYIRITAEYRPQKADPYRVRCTVGGNLIDFPGDKSTKTAELITIKCLLNNIVSTPNARAACIDLKDFYLKNDLPGYEYVFFLASLIPEEFIAQYKHKIHITPNGHVYARVEKGMYGLPQAGKVASDIMIPWLKLKGYVKTGRIPGLFKTHHQQHPLCPGGRRFPGPILQPSRPPTSRHHPQRTLRDETRHGGNQVLRHHTRKGLHRPPRHPIHARLH